MLSVFLSPKNIGAYQDRHPKIPKVHLNMTEIAITIPTMAIRTKRNPPQAKKFMKAGQNPFFFLGLLVVFSVFSALIAVPAVSISCSFLNGFGHQMNLTIFISEHCIALGSFPFHHLLPCIPPNKKAAIRKFSFSDSGPTIHCFNLQK
jgi:hypothetical protein